MKCDIKGLRGFAVLTVVLTCLAVQVVFTLPAYGYAIVGWGDIPSAPAGNDFIAISGGGYHNLALRSDGSIVAWGWNIYGQVSETPSGNEFTAISAGGYHSLALKSDGTIVGWGRNDYGQAESPDGCNFIAISAGGHHSLALRSDGTIVTWGYDHYHLTDSPEGNDFIAISAGWLCSLALKDDGTIVGWGGTSYGEGDPSPGDGFIAISAGGQHSLALKFDGSIVGWGDNSQDQAEPPAGNNFTAIDAGASHGIALKSDGGIVGWGDNSQDQAEPPAGNNFKAIAAGRWHGLALVSTNSPPVADAGDSQTIEDTSSSGASVTLDGSGSTDDGEIQPLTYTWTWTDGSATGIDPTVTLPLGTTMVTLTVYDGELSDTDTVEIQVVDTTPPEITIDAPGPYGLYAEGNLVFDFSAYDSVSGNIVPPALLGTLSDPSGFSGTVVPGDVPGAGVYTLLVTAIDQTGNQADETVLFVVYDPSDGFVTGGGWIWSPEGAFAYNPSATGKANLGFVSKYKKGATVPTGQTEFVFQAGNLNFHSTSYEWLVVTGSNYARFKGTGTINGSGEYKFMLWAGDSDPDTFRIRIWTEDSDSNETTVYDNGFDQSLGGGSIVIHTK